MTANRYGKLAKNSIVFTIGNMGSKLISLILIPLYTYCLSTDQFGTVDLVTTTLSLLLPIVTMSVYDAVLRFVMDENYDKKTVLNNGLMLTLLGFIIAVLMYPVFMMIFPFGNFIKYFYLLLLTQSINSSVSQFVRASGKVKLFASVGIIGAFVVLTANIIFLVVLHWGIAGYLMALISADIVSFFFLLIFGKVYRYLSIHKMNRKLLKTMLVYSMPLIPNALMWWVMGVSDRFIITYFLGVGANGLYAIANKIPNVLNIINTIFFQAWQMSAIEEAESNSKSQFYTNVFNIFSATMLVFTSVFLVLLKWVMTFAVSPNYYESWKYVPFLLLGIVFASFSGFLGTNYIAAKNTTGVFRTSAVGAVINIAVNFTLIPVIGINGASISTMLSFLVIWILRIYDTRQFVRIQIDIKRLLTTLALLLIQIGVLYTAMPFEYLLEVLLFFGIIIVQKKEIAKVAGLVSVHMHKRWQKKIESGSISK